MRRRSQQLHGVPPALAQELAAIDEEFYGSDGSSDSDDSDQPMAKRARGAREREDEYFSDSCEDLGEPPRSGSSEGDAADDDGYQQVCGKLQNLGEAGCGCGKTNHFAIIEEPKAQKFMFDFLQLGKAQRKSYALASLSACYRTSATERHHGAAEAAGEEGPVTRKSYSYGILGHTVCRTTYLEMQCCTPTYVPMPSAESLYSMPTTVWGKTRTAQLSATCFGDACVACRRTLNSTSCALAMRAAQSTDTSVL